MKSQATLDETYADALAAGSDDHATSYLGSIPTKAASARSAEPAATDWLAVITSSDLQTAFYLDEDALLVQPAHSGMTEHLAPPRLRPTIGARFRVGIRKGTLSAILTALSIAALGGGAYTLYTTGWLQNGERNVPAMSTPGLPGGNSVETTTRNAPQPPVSAPMPQNPAPVASGSPDELRGRGMEQLRAGNYRAAADLLESAIDTGGGDAVTYYQLGLALMGAQSGEHAAEDAEMAFRSAISLDASWPAPKQLLAESLMRRGFYKEAIPYAQQAVQLDQTRADTWLTLGRAYEGAGDKAEATKAFAEASRIAPAPPALP